MCFGPICAFGHICPGIRWQEQENADDQKRVATPDQAVAHGANAIVVGRPIVEAQDPVESFQRFLNAAVSSG